VSRTQRNVYIYYYDYRLHVFHALVYEHNRGIALSRLCNKSMRSNGTLAS